MSNCMCCLRRCAIAAMSARSGMPVLSHRLMTKTAKRILCETFVSHGSGLHGGRFGGGLFIGICWLMFLLFLKLSRWVQLDMSLLFMHVFETWYCVVELCFDVFHI